MDQFEGLPSYIITSFPNDFYSSLPRKKKVSHKTTSTDDKRLQSVLKRLGVTTVPGIEEVNIFSNDTVTHFTSPKGNFSSYSSHLET